VIRESGSPSPVDPVASLTVYVPDREGKKRPEKPASTVVLPTIPGTTGTEMLFGNEVCDGRPRRGAG
jgi:hypothetical protein